MATKEPVSEKEAYALMMRAGVGLYPIPNNRSGFYQVGKAADGTLTAQRLQAPGDLVYNCELQICDSTLNCPDPEAAYAKFYADLRDKLAATK